MDTYCLDREVFSPVYNKEGQLVGYNTFREIFLIHAKGADGNNYETGPYKVEIFVKARDLGTALGNRLRASALLKVAPALYRIV